MTQLRVRFSPHPDNALDVAPLLLLFDDGRQADALAPHVAFRTTTAVSGTAKFSVPGYKPFIKAFRLEENESFTLEIDDTDIQPTKDPIVDEQLTPMRVSEHPDSRPEWYSPHAGADAKSSSFWNSTRRIDITGPSAARSKALIPSSLLSEALRIERNRTNGSFLLLPADPRLALLTHYLQDGSYILGAATARSLELRLLMKIPNTYDETMMLAVGYGHAFAGESSRLLRWCKRQNAGAGTDVALLRAECASLHGNHKEAIWKLTHLVGRPPPSFIFGLELGVRRLTAYIRGLQQESARSDQISATREALEALYNDWQEMLLRSDPDSVFVVLPSDPEAALEPRAELPIVSFTRKVMMWIRASPLWYRFRATSIGSILVKEFQMAAEEPNTRGPSQLSRAAVTVAVAAIGLWAVASLLLILQRDASDIAWARMAWVFGSVEAIAFAAAGVLFGTAVTRGQAQKAEERADEAQSRADAQEKVARSGMALGAALQAEEQAREAESEDSGRSMGEDEGGDDQAIKRHARMSRALFGDLL